MSRTRRVAAVALVASVAFVAAGCGKSTPYESLSHGTFAINGGKLLPPGSIPAPESGPGPHLNRGDGRADHWHAALGVNVCGAWQPGPIWPQFTSAGAPARDDDPDVYAGLHTHTLSNGEPDGVVHMEPAQRDEAGRSATLGRYVEFGGWRVSADSMQLWPDEDGRLIDVQAGDKCGGSTAELRWATGKYVPGESTRLTEQHGDPSRLQLTDNQVIALYFVPSSTLLGTLGDVPSVVNLPSSNGVPAATTTTSPRS